jgi:hypothetical protein
MKKKGLLFFILGLTFNLDAQKKATVQDGIKVVYEPLFTSFKKQYLYKNTVN